LMPTILCLRGLIPSDTPYDSRVISKYVRRSYDYSRTSCFGLDVNKGDSLIAIDDIDTEALLWWQPSEYLVKVWQPLDHGFFVSQNGFLCYSGNYRKHNPGKYLMLD
jgi:hypothetical protein